MTRDELIEKMEAALDRVLEPGTASAEVLVSAILNTLEAAGVVLCEGEPVGWWRYGNSGPPMRARKPIEFSLGPEKPGIWFDDGQPLYAPIGAKP